MDMLELLVAQRDFLQGSALVKGPVLESELLYDLTDDVVGHLASFFPHAGSDLRYAHGHPYDAFVLGQTRCM